MKLNGIPLFPPYQILYPSYMAYMRVDAPVLYDQIGSPVYHTAGSPMKGVLASVPTPRIFAIIFHVRRKRCEKTREKGKTGRFSKDIMNIIPFCMQRQTVFAKKRSMDFVSVSASP